MKIKEKIKETEEQLKKEQEHPVKDYGYIIFLKDLLKKYKLEKKE